MTDEQIWAERIVAWKASGLTAAEFCAASDLPLRALRYRSRQWKRKQRVESSAERKYWRESDARAYVDEHAASGLTIAAFAESRGISAPRLKRWRRRFEIRSKSAARRGPTVAVSAAATVVRIARVERAKTEREVPAATATLSIELGGARVAVPAGFDATTLRAVIEALFVGRGAP